MATILFTAIGTALGGPLGGAIGTLVGSQVDRAIIGSPTRQGPRLKELSVSTSTYGSAIARHFGTMRTPGTIIWSTDLIESSEKTGGGKGSTQTRMYSYSVSFAVALASRPIIDVRRIWADGNLLRGAAGDLKTGGALRVYSGHGEQRPDPLLASAIGPACPAHRGTAYCVFEGLQLADFGNRIPALTFEIVADEGAVSLVEIARRAVESGRDLPGLVGFSDEGGAAAELLGTIDMLYPLTCVAGATGLLLGAGDASAGGVPTLGEAVADRAGDGFAPESGALRRRRADARSIPNALRYYDVSRDYQAGLQRADGRARVGRGAAIEFPGALAAGDARDLLNAAAERAGWSVDRLAWRMAEIDPALRPGMVVRVPDRPGHWRIDSWEWRDGVVETELRRLPRGPARSTTADAGQSLPIADLPATPTVLAAFELPWDGQGSGAGRQVYAAASSAGAGWRGAALYEQSGEELLPLGVTGTRRAVIGALTSALAGSPAMRLERGASIDVELVAEDLALDTATPAMLAAGANRALLGEEVLQFAQAVPLGGGAWRLNGLLRGRGGSEGAAMGGHAPGARFVLLDDGPIALDPARLSGSPVPLIAALGLADHAPAVAATANAGATLRPLCPVHARMLAQPGGGARLEWTRRARGAWRWADGVETPLNEEGELYVVGIGLPDAPLTRWETAQSWLAFEAGEWGGIVAEHAGAPMWVRQIGRFAASDPLLLAIVT